MWGGTGSWGIFCRETGRGGVSVGGGQVAFALVVTVALTAGGGVHWLTAAVSPTESGTAEKPSPSGCADDRLCRVSAFTGTAMASDDALSAAARSANIPTDPVAGWDLPTTTGVACNWCCPPVWGGRRDHRGRPGRLPGSRRRFQRDRRKQRRGWAHHHPHPPQACRERYDSFGGLRPPMGRRCPQCRCSCAPPRPTR